MICTDKSKSSSYAFDDKSHVVPKKKQQKPKPTLSESEMEAARQLIELSNGDSSSGHRSLTGGGDVNNSSSNSFSVQGRPQEEEQQKSELDEVDVSSNVETIMDEGESLGEIRTSRRRKHKRYRFILDLYNVTEPVISCY